MDRNKIGIDVDGILADAVGAIVKVVNKLGYNLPDNYKPSDWSWSNAGLPDRTLARAWDSIVNTTDFWLTLSPTSDINAMAEFFCEHSSDTDIYFITARPETSGKSARTQTSLWLREYLGDPTGDINVLVVDSGMQKAQVIEALRLGSSIDDHPPTVVANKSLRKHNAYLLRKPWNEYESKAYNLKTVDTLREYFASEQLI